jgi:PAS domain S-box-containing protein
MQMNPSPDIGSSYDHRLVALSLVIAVLTSYTALDLAGRVTANRGFARAMWLLGGAFAMGTGIWCTHYTGMLAFRLPIPVYYHIPTVIYSLIAAIVASYIALYVVSRERLTVVQVISGSVLMGAAIATMHYTGMAAMRLNAMHHYVRTLWILSIALAVVISFAGLLIIYSCRGAIRTWKHKVGSALLLGVAIPMMHYTGMAAVHFVPMTMAPDLSNSLDISTVANLSILCATLVILGFALLTSLVDRRLTAQQLLLENERTMLRSLIDNIPDFMYIKDLESRFVISNPQVARCVGAATPEEMIGKTDFDYFPSELARQFRDDEMRVMHFGEPLFNRKELVTDINGNEIPILTTKVPLRDRQDRICGLAGVGRNITDLKNAEEALKAAEHKYRGMFDEALVGIFQLDSAGHLLKLNPAMAQFLMYSSPDEMLGTLTEPLWTTAVSAERQGEFMVLMQEVGHVRGFELEVFRKDKSKIWISASVRAIVKDGAIRGFEGMFEDITERRLLREQLSQAQKLESVGQLAAGIAHEINTPTQYIGDNIRFLKNIFCDLAAVLDAYGRLWNGTRTGSVTVPLKEEISSLLDRVNLEILLDEIPKAIDDSLEGVKRVSTLVSAMKEFSHPGTKEKTPLDLNRAIQSTITVAQNEWKYVAEMETHFEPTLPLVHCLPGEFNQVILNLVVNAAHAIEEVSKNRNGEKGKIRIETRKLPAGVEIRIADTGAGIPVDVRARIFDPFFTTKEIGKGTGQGLAIARSVIVGKHNGTINYETVVGKGTTFIICLPHLGKALPGSLVRQ